MAAGLPPIEVRRYGDRGPEVVVLHGGPGAPGSVRGLARDLARSCLVLEPLQRRSGGVPLTVARHVEDLSRVAPPRAAIVGCSWGAMLGLSFATAHAERVTSLALVGCGTYDEDSRAEHRRRLAERLGPDGRARFEALQLAAAGAIDPATRDRALAELGALVDRAVAADPIPEAPDDAFDDLAVDARGHEETWNDVLRLQREGVEPAAFRAVRAPCLMLHGAEDPHPGRSTYEVLHRFVPHLEYVEIPRCGHVPWREGHGREPFLRDLRTWLLGTR